MNSPSNNKKYDYSFASDYLIALRDFALSKGVSTRALLSGSDIDLEELLNPAERIDRKRMHLLIGNMMKLRPPAHISALEYGRFLALGAHGFMGVAAQSCKTIKEACEILCLYIKTRSDISLAILRETEFGLSIEITLDENQEDTFDQDMEHYFELITSRNLDYFFTLVVNNVLPEEKIQYHLMQDRPDNFNPDDYYLSGSTHFSSEKFEIRIPNSWLIIEIISNDIDLKNIAEEKCKSELKSLSANDLLQEIEDRLRSKGGISLSIEDAAKCFFMSTSTLQRKLKLENTTFQQIKKSVRLAIAQDLLINSKRSIEDIAEQLGFSDGSNFNKSFKSWTDMSPAEYRKTKSL